MLILVGLDVVEVVPPDHAIRINIVAEVAAVDRLILISEDLVRVSFVDENPLCDTGRTGPLGIAPSDILNFAIALHRLSSSEH